MGVTLRQVLELVGKLDDSPGENAPRERFRRFLHENVKEAAEIRDYVQECINASGEQYSRALQDLVNHLGILLGFEVVHGRYQGVQGQIGFDGHWISPKIEKRPEFHLVVEVKTTEVFHINTATLVSYVDSLISQKAIQGWKNALGLYVVGRPDPEIRQLEYSIREEGRTDQLRIASVESLLSLAEMMTEYDVTHDDVLTVMRPSGPSVDSLVDMMTRSIAQAEEPEEEKMILGQPSTEGTVAYWLTPVKADEEATAEETIRTLVGKEEVYAFGDRTPGRKDLKPGDWICFYATSKGVVGHAKVASRPDKKMLSTKVRHPDKYPWQFQLSDVRLYLENPIVIDDELRSRLEYFRGRDLSKPWAWFVQATRRIGKNDFDILTQIELPKSRYSR
jgi:hypothetical protein